jgi:hypothetical protein
MPRLALVPAGELRPGWYLHIDGIGWTLILSVHPSEQQPGRVLVRTVAGYTVHLSDVALCYIRSARVCAACRGTGRRTYTGQDDEDIYLAACDVCGDGRIGRRGTGLIAA